MPDLFKSRDGVKRSNVDIGSDAFAEVVSNSGYNSWTVSFTKASASGINSPDMTQLFRSAGFTVTQSAGNAVIVSSTTANEEFLAVSNRPFQGSLTARGRVILSQRIANNNFAVLLADRIGERLPVTINSATSITVTIPGGHSFTSENVGQFINVAALTGMAGAVPGRYAIASVPSTSTVNFTVAGWPASGSGTCTLFGWNYYRNLYTGATVTNANFDAQRFGYATGDTVATINTTASPGHMFQICVEGRSAYYDDSLVASTTAPAVGTRASRYENLPDFDTPLYLYLWAFNGSVAPASATTWTVGFLSVESFLNNPVAIQSIRLLGAHGLLPVTVSAGTITTVSTVSTLTGGAVAEDAATTSNPIIVGGIVRTAVAPTTLVAGDAARVTMSSGAAAVVFPYSVPDVTAPANLSLNSTTAVAIRAAGAAGVRNYLGALQVYNSSATAVDVIVLDGATELWRQTVNATSGREFQFPIPLRGTAATALNINLSAAVTAVRATAQTFQAP